MTIRKRSIVLVVIVIVYTAEETFLRIFIGIRSQLADAYEVLIIIDAMNSLICLHRIVILILVRIILMTQSNIYSVTVESLVILSNLVESLSKTPSRCDAQTSRSCSTITYVRVLITLSTIVQVVQRVVYGERKTLYRSNSHISLTRLVHTVVITVVPQLLNITITTYIGTYQTVIVVVCIFARIVSYITILIQVCTCLRVMAMDRHVRSDRTGKHL